MRTMVLVKLISSVILAAVSLVGTACDPTTPRAEAETWIWCGVHPDEPTALARAKTLHDVAGIDASFGPCLPPPVDYTPADPGGRYLDPAGYKRAMLNNAAAGMKTIVYDARIWSADSIQRQQALTFWQPYLASIRAWDMGDEFDPDTPHWATLVARWDRVMRYVTPLTGVGPFTNHLGSAAVLNLALIDMPSQIIHLSYDAYDVSASLALAAQFNPRVDNLMCAINALDHSGFHPTNLGIESQMIDHRDVGCDLFLIFGGDMPYATPGFNTPSLVYSNGSPTPLAEAVYKGATR